MHPMMYIPTHYIYIYAHPITSVVISREKAIEDSAAESRIGDEGAWEDYNVHLFYERNLEERGHDFGETLKAQHSSCGTRWISTV
jgi:hypothetical protein